MPLHFIRTRQDESRGYEQRPDGLLALRFPLCALRFALCASRFCIRKNTLNAEIRLYDQADEVAVVGVWHRAGLAAYPYLPTWQTFTLEQARSVFQQYIAPRCTLWIGVADQQIVAYMAMNKSYIDRLYVDPVAQRQGWGKRLIAHAKALQPHGLELHTHQENLAARALYEREGFVAVAFGISPPPESAPDVEYHWRS